MQFIRAPTGVILKMKGANRYFLKKVHDPYPRDEVGRQVPGFDWDMDLEVVRPEPIQTGRRYWVWVSENWDRACTGCTATASIWLIERHTALPGYRHAIHVSDYRVVIPVVTTSLDPRVKAIIGSWEIRSGSFIGRLYREQRGCTVEFDWPIESNKRIAMTLVDSKGSFHVPSEH